VPTISHSNSPTVMSSPSETRDSDAQNSYSSHPSLVWNSQESTNSPSNLS
jgi:hypothetical protein